MAKKGQDAEGQYEDSAAIVDRKAELAACTPVPVEKSKFNTKAKIPYGLTIDHMYQAMTEFTSFLGFIYSHSTRRTSRDLRPCLCQPISAAWSVSS